MEDWTMMMGTVFLPNCSQPGQKFSDGRIREVGHRPQVLQFTEL